jgi:HAD superfamily hydrolase (TIGR01484 family)
MYLSLEASYGSGLTVSCPCYMYVEREAEELKYRLIALDMDGTLLGTDHQVSEENRNWMNKATDAGIHVCLSTGRGIQSVLPYVEELKISTPMVTVNGSEVWEKPGSLWVRHTVEPTWIYELRELALEHEVWYWGYTTEGVFNKDIWAERPISEYTWLKFGYYSDDDEAREAVRETVQRTDRYEMTNSHPNNIELNPKGISKASGLREIGNRIGISMSEVVAVGDSLNDIAMIREAGLGVAMGNAQEAVKQAADRVTDTNVNHGVAAVIRSVLEDY